jgi:hypothetical protein
MARTQEEFIDDIVDYVKLLPQEDKATFALNAMFELVLWGGCCNVEMLGIIECVKLDVIKFVINYDGDDEDDEGEEWKKLINKN